MAYSPEENLDLGLGDYSGDSSWLSGISEYKSPFDEEEKWPQVSLDTPVLDAYDKADYTVSELGKRATHANATRRHWATRRKKYVDEVLTPYYKETVGDFAPDYKSTDIEREGKMLEAMESQFLDTQTRAAEEPGFFGGVSEGSQQAASDLKGGIWSRFGRIKRDLSRIVAADDEATSQADSAQFRYDGAQKEFDRVPIALKQSMDDLNLMKGKLETSSNQERMLLDNVQFDDPIYDPNTGRLANKDRASPYAPVEVGGTLSSSQRKARARKAAEKQVFNRQIQEFTDKRTALQQDRRFRDLHEIFTSVNGYRNSHPLGLSRKEEDILDLERAQQHGFTTFEGLPIEEAFEKMGGPKKLAVAKMMESLFTAEKTWMSSQQKYLAQYGRSGGEDRKDAMLAAEAAKDKIFEKVVRAGFGHEALKRAESTHGWTSLVDSAKRGMLQSDIAELTLDFMYGKTDESTLQRLIDLTKQSEKIPEASAMKAYREADANGALEVLSYLLFDNPEAGVNMLVESMMAFVPAFFNTAIEVGIGGAVAGGAGSKFRGFKGGTMKGVKKGLGYAAAANWGVASFSLESMGQLTESMNELGVDWQNPKVFAAAWSNDTFRKEMRKKAAKKGLPIAFFDMLSAGLAGKMRAILKDPSRLLNPKALAKGVKATPRFTLPQRGGTLVTEFMADAGFGMTGEALGQIWANDIGWDELDWKAVIPEGVIGMGPMGMRALYDMAGPHLPGKLGSRFRDLTDSPMEFGNEAEYAGPDGTVVGTQGTVTRAGMKDPFTGNFQAANDMTGYLLGETKEAPDSHKGIIIQENIARLYELDTPKMQQVRIVLTDRTPDGNPDNPGTFEVDPDTGTALYYINTKLLTEDPLATFMHESGHMARYMMYGDWTEVEEIYKTLSPEEELDFWSKYLLSSEKPFNQLSEKEQKKVRDSLKGSSRQRVVEEWFAFQWARTLAGAQPADVHPEIRETLDIWLKDHVTPWLSRWMGEKPSKKEADVAIRNQILDSMGYTKMGLPDWNSPKIRGTHQGAALPAGQEKLDELQGLGGFADRLARQDPTMRVHVYELMRHFGFSAEQISELKKGIEVEAEGTSFLEMGETFAYMPEEKAEIVRSVVEKWVGAMGEIRGAVAPEAVARALDKAFPSSIEDLAYVTKSDVEVGPKGTAAALSGDTLMSSKNKAAADLYQALKEEEDFIGPRTDEQENKLWGLRKRVAEEEMGAQLSEKVWTDAREDLERIARINELEYHMKDKETMQAAYDLIKDKITGVEAVVQMTDEQWHAHVGKVRKDIASAAMKDENVKKRWAGRVHDTATPTDEQIAALTSDDIVENVGWNDVLRFVGKSEKFKELSSLGTATVVEDVKAAGREPGGAAGMATPDEAREAEHLQTLKLKRFKKLVEQEVGVVKRKKEALEKEAATMRGPVKGGPTVKAAEAKPKELDAKLLNLVKKLNIPEGRLQYIKYMKKEKAYVMQTKKDAEGYHITYADGKQKIVQKDELGPMYKAKELKEFLKTGDKDVAPKVAKQSGEKRRLVLESFARLIEMQAEGAVELAEDIAPGTPVHELIGDPQHKSRLTEWLLAQGHSPDFVNAFLDSDLLGSTHPVTGKIVDAKELVGLVPNYEPLKPLPMGAPERAPGLVDFNEKLGKLHAQMDPYVSEWMSKLGKGITDVAEAKLPLGKPWEYGGVGKTAPAAHERRVQAMANAMAGKPALERKLNPEQQTRLKEIKTQTSKLNKSLAKLEKLETAIAPENYAVRWGNVSANFGVFEKRKKDSRNPGKEHEGLYVRDPNIAKPGEPGYDPDARSLDAKGNKLPLYRRATLIEVAMRKKFFMQPRVTERKKTRGWETAAELAALSDKDFTFTPKVDTKEAAKKKPLPEGVRDFVVEGFADEQKIKGKDGKETTMDFRVELKGKFKNRMDLIEAGKSTGITRAKDKIDAYEKDDVIELRGGRGDDRVFYVKILEPAKPVKEIEAEEWSQAEGWAKEQHAYSAANDAYQLKFELLKDFKPEVVEEEEEAGEINISHGDGDNPYLSNFQEMGEDVGFKYDGHSFKTVEGAYQAYKTGVYQEGYEDLSGGDARKRAHHPDFKVAPDKSEIDAKHPLYFKKVESYNYALMRKLLQIRYDNDTQFRNELDDAPDNITHKTKAADDVWTEMLPMLLKEVRGEEAVEGKPEAVLKAPVSINGIKILDDLITGGKSRFDWSRYGEGRAERGKDIWLAIQAAHASVGTPSFQRWYAAEQDRAFNKDTGKVEPGVSGATGRPMHGGTVQETAYEDATEGTPLLGILAKKLLNYYRKKGAEYNKETGTYQIVTKRGKKGEVLKREDVYELKGMFRPEDVTADDLLAIEIANVEELFALYIGDKDTEKYGTPTTEARPGGGLYVDFRHARIMSEAIYQAELTNIERWKALGDEEKAAVQSIRDAANGERADPDSKYAYVSTDAGVQTAFENLSKTHPKLSAESRNSIGAHINAKRLADVQEATWHGDTYELYSGERATLGNVELEAEEALYEDLVTKSGEQPLPSEEKKKGSFPLMRGHVNRAVFQFAAKMALDKLAQHYAEDMAVFDGKGVAGKPGYFGNNYLFIGGLVSPDKSEAEAKEIMATLKPWAEAEESRGGPFDEQGEPVPRKQLTPQQLKEMQRKLSTPLRQRLKLMGFHMPQEAAINEDGRAENRKRGEEYLYVEDEAEWTRDVDADPVSNADVIEFDVETQAGEVLEPSTTRGALEKPYDVMRSLSKARTLSRAGRELRKGEKPWISTWATDNLGKKERELYGRVSKGPSAHQIVEIDGNKYVYSGKNEAWQLKGSPVTDMYVLGEIADAWFDKEAARAKMDYTLRDSSTTITMSQLIEYILGRKQKNEGIARTDYLAQSDKDLGGVAYSMLRNIPFEHLLDNMIRDLGLDPNDFLLTESRKKPEARSIEALARKLHPIARAVIAAERVDLYGHASEESMIWSMDPIREQTQAEEFRAGMGEDVDTGGEATSATGFEYEKAAQAEVYGDSKNVDKELSREFGDIPGVQYPEKGTESAQGRVTPEGGKTSEQRINTAVSFLLIDDGGSSRVKEFVRWVTELVLPKRPKDKRKRQGVATYNKPEPNSSFDKGLRLFAAEHEGVPYAKVTTKMVHDQLDRFRALGQRLDPDGESELTRTMQGMFDRAHWNLQSQDLSLYARMGMPVNKYMAMTARASALVFDSVIKGPALTRAEEGGSEALGGKIEGKPFKGALLAKPALPAGTLLDKMPRAKKYVDKWVEPATGPRDRLWNAYVDQYAPMEYAVNTGLKAMGIEKGSAKYDDMHSYIKAHIMYGVGHAQMEELQLRYVEPFQDLLRKHDVTYGEFGEYLIARFVPSRNQHVDVKLSRALESASKADKPTWQKLIDEKKGRGSGHTTSWALEKVKEYESKGNFSNFLADSRDPLSMFYSMNKTDLDLRVTTGLISESEQKAMTQAAEQFSWKGKSRFVKDNYTYAPLVGFAGETESVFEAEQELNTLLGGIGKSSGRGFSQSAAMHLAKAAFGRTTQPDPNQVLPQSFQQVAGGMIRSQRNTVAQSFGLLHDEMRLIKMKGVMTDGTKVTKDVQDRVTQEYDNMFEDLYDDKGVLVEEVMTAYRTNANELADDAALPITLKYLSDKYSNDPGVFIYRKGGEAMVIKLRRQGVSAEQAARNLSVASSLSNLRYQPLTNPASKVANVLTKFIARMVTTWNFSFVAGNFIRDYATAYINLTEDEKASFVGSALNLKNIGSAMKGIWAAERARTRGELTHTMAEIKAMSIEDAKKDPITRYLYAKAHGAKVGMFRHDTVAEQISKLDKAAREGKMPTTAKGMLKFARGVDGFVESANAAIENSIRISSFWAAIDAGLSQQQAADVARNATVDFNRGGTLKQGMNAWFMFFGASVASMHRMHKALMRRGGYGSPKALKLYGSLAAASAFMNILNRALSEDEEEEGEKPYLDRVTPFVRDTHFNLVIPAWMTPDDKPRTLTAPVSLGWSFFHALGNGMADYAVNVWTGGKEGAGMFEVSTRLTDSIQTAFNPIGGGGSLATMITPTVGKPLVEIGMNENFMGQPIVREDGGFELPSPAFTRDPNKTTEKFTDLSEAINSLMGGDDVVSGSWTNLFEGPLSRDMEQKRFNVSGAEMEHFMRGYFGGPMDVLTSFMSGGKSAKGEDGVRLERVPGLRRFWRGSAADWDTVHRFYDLRMRVKTAAKDMQNLKADEKKEFLRTHKPLIALDGMIKKADNAVGAANRFIRTTKKSSKLSDSDKKQRLEKLEYDKLQHMLKVLARADKFDIGT